MGGKSIIKLRSQPEKTSLSRNSLPAAHCRLRTEGGVILIALLWILTALSVIALSFSRESFVEVAAARNAQSLESSYFVARAGIDMAVYQLIRKRLTSSLRQAELRQEPEPLELGIVRGSLGGGTYQVNIQDESGKISVNNVSEQQLRSLCEVIGIPKPDADIITDSILDWRDSDTAHRLNGAEDDYYEALNPPYKARDGALETIEELLLIRGVTAEYFYGRPERNPDGSVSYRYGLSRYLSAYVNLPGVNVNFAPLPVLLSIPGMSPQAAGAIYERRLVKPFDTTLEITRELGVSLETTTAQFLTTNRTEMFTFTSSAHTANSKARRVIRTVIGLQGTNKPYTTLYWNENVPDYEGMTP